MSLSKESLSNSSHSLVNENAEQYNLHKEFLKAESKVKATASGPIKRRRFLGISLLSFMGFGMPLNSKGKTVKNDKPFVSDGIISDNIGGNKQTDSFEEKIKLIQEA